MSLKKGKSVGVDNILAEPVQAGGGGGGGGGRRRRSVTVSGEQPTPWTQSLVITLPKKDILQLCQNYRTISLISHSSKVMLNIILIALNPKLKRQLQFAEEQAGLRARRSAIEQICNLRNLYEKYPQHQQNLYHVFTDFKKAFDRV